MRNLWIKIAVFIFIIAFVVAFNYGGCLGSVENISGSSGGIFTIVTNPVTNVTQTTAILNGTVNPGGVAANVYFEYGKTTTYGIYTSYQYIGAGTTDINVSANISGLSANTTYNFRIKAVRGGDTYDGPNLTFTTPGLTPICVTGFPTNVSYDSATLNGTVNANTLATTAYFNYGLTTSYTETTISQPIGSGTSNFPVTNDISGLLESTLYNFRVVGTNSAGTTYGNNRTFTTLVSPRPICVTKLATNITANSARLNGTVNPNAFPTNAYFSYYDLTTSYAIIITPSIAIGSGTANIEVTADISGLSLNTGYSFKIVGTSSGGTNYGNNRTFTTGNSSGSAPTCMTDDVDNITFTSAILYGTVIPNGLDTTAWFEYGISATPPEYTITTNTQSIGSGTTSVAITAIVDSLTLNTPYNFRVVGTSNSGTTYGNNLTFTTLLPIAPTCAANAATNVTYNSAQLNATVNPEGANTTAYFQWGLSTSYGNNTNPQDLGSGASAVAVSETITGLSANKVYYFRISATNYVGTTYGANRVFGTWLQTTFTTGTFNSTVTTTGAANVILSLGASPTSGTYISSAITPISVSCWGILTYTYTAPAGTIFTVDVLDSFNSDAVLVTNVPSGINLSQNYVIFSGVTGIKLRGNFSNIVNIATSTLSDWGVAWTDDTPPPAPLLPVVVTTPATAISTTSAVLNAIVNPNGANTNAYFQWGSDTSYGNNTNSQDLGSGTGNVEASVTVSSLSPNTLYNFRCVATNSVGTTNGGNLTFTIQPPTCTTNAADTITYNSARLNGTVNPNGFATTVYFNYGLTTSYTVTTTSQAIGNVAADVAVSATTGTLTPVTLYNFRVVGTSEIGTTYGDNLTFTTPARPPTCTTNNATNIATTSATLNGTVNPNGFNVTSCYFDYSTTTSYGISATASSLPTGTSPVSVTANVSSLTLGTLYNFRVVATNAGGTTNGGNLQFTTLSTPTCTTNAATGVTYNSATLNGTVNPNAFNVTACIFQYGTTTAYGTTVNATPYTFSSTTNVSAAISSLSASTTYNFRVGATNSSGTAYGNNLTFTTSVIPLPICTTNAATNATYNSATLNGNVNTNSGPTVTACIFQYWTTTPYGTTVNATPYTFSSTTNVSAAISALSASTTYNFRVGATNAGGTTYGNNLTFNTSAIPLPICTTNAATNIGATTVTLNGNVNTNSGPTVTACIFQYGTTTAYGTTVNATPYTFSSTTNVSAAISGLTINTQYNFRVGATNAGGTTYGGNLQFTTLSTPTCTTNAATGVTATSAVLNGTVNPNGLNVTSCIFQYGTTTAYGTTVNATPYTFSSTSNVSAAIGGGGSTVTFNPTSTGTSGTIQSWTVPSNGTYQIEVFGAQGGTGTSYTGGLGARMRGDFTLTSGQVLRILVGQQGGTNTSYQAGGGGGGSFVTDSSNNPIIIAGGGAGGGGNSYVGNGNPGLITTSGGSSGNYAGGTSGAGGAGGGSGSGGGGGLTGNGGAAYNAGGLSFTNGGTGSASGNCAASGNGATGVGGFGGGSGGEWCSQGVTGAGGGYSGGAGADNASTARAGGGGSYNNGANPSNSAGARTGAGLVTITPLGTPLSAGTVYNFRVGATNSAGTAYGGNLTFTTSAAPTPICTTNAATGVGSTTATLNGNVNPNGFSVTACIFQYGTTTAYGTTVNATPYTFSSTSNVSATAGGAGGSPVTFNYTGGVQTWTVPSGVTSVTIQCYGAEGGTYSGVGGLGGYDTGTLGVTGGQVLNIYVGGAGTWVNTAGQVAGGFNGGGYTYGNVSSSYASSGGGASDVRVGGTALGNRVIVAGGGGGGGYYNSASNGGAGGGTTGGTGATSYGGSYTGGGGGTQSAGGAAGNSSYAQAGSLGQGGNSTGSSGGWNGCGGGGGYYGGGSGGALGAGGGGGSGYIGGVSGGSSSNGVRSGNGQIIITPAGGTPLSASTQYNFRVGATNSAGTAYGGNLTFTTAAGFTPITFSYTGAQQTWTVPTGITSIAVDVQGAQGGTSGSNTGGLGARTQATLAVTAGSTLYIYVGQQPSLNAAGYNGGGSGNSTNCRGGGGGSDIRSGGTALGNRVAVAGGGGGACVSWTVTGGAGGGPNGAIGTSSNGASYCGSGGTQSAGGAGQTVYSPTYPGTLGQGGNAGTANSNGGAGGGGYYGGGGGDAGGGGGGSSWSSGSSITYTGGYRSGNGQIIISNP